MVAHFWRATWAICSHRSFLVSDLSDLLTSLIKKGGVSELLVSFKTFFLRIARFLWAKERMSDLLKKTSSLAHLSWANRSQAFICDEQPKRFAHSRSFDLSDLSKWANSQPCKMVVKFSQIKVRRIRVHLDPYPFGRIRPKWTSAGYPTLDLNIHTNCNHTFFL